MLYWLFTKRFIAANIAPMAGKTISINYLLFKFVFPVVFHGKGFAIETFKGFYVIFGVFCACGFVKALTCFYEKKLFMEKDGEYKFI